MKIVFGIYNILIIKLQIFITQKRNKLNCFVNNLTLCIDFRCVVTLNWLLRVTYNKFKTNTTIRMFVFQSHLIRNSFVFVSIYCSETIYRKVKLRWHVFFRYFYHLKWIACGFSVGIGSNNYILQQLPGERFLWLVSLAWTLGIQVRIQYWLDRVLLNVYQLYRAIRNLWGIVYTLLAE